MSLAGIAGAAAAEPDYEAMDEEHRRLLGVIHLASAGEAGPREEPRDVVVVRAQLPTALDREAARRGGRREEDSAAGGAPQITLRLFVTYTARARPPSSPLRVLPCSPPCSALLRPALPCTALHCSALPWGCPSARGGLHKKEAWARDPQPGPAAGRRRQTTPPSQPGPERECTRLLQPSSPPG